MSPDKLAYMANLIGKFFAHQPHDKAIAAIAGHIQKFWDPRMRRDILAHFDAVQLTHPLGRQLNACANPRYFDDASAMNRASARAMFAQSPVFRQYNADQGVGAMKLLQ